MSTSAPAAPSTPYEPPEELQKRAFAELEAATSEELEGAQRCYEACNRALGGRSGVTGSPLPTWEAMSNPLVKYSWLEVYRTNRAHFVREVDSAVVELRTARRDLLAHFLADTRLHALLTPLQLEVHRRLVAGDAEEAPTMLLSKLVGVATATARELSELRACVAGLHASLRHESGLATGHMALLHTAARHMHALGYTESARTLEACGTGMVPSWLSVQKPAPLTAEELAVVDILVESRRNPNPTGLPHTEAQVAAWGRLRAVAPQRVVNGAVTATAREWAEAETRTPWARQSSLFEPPERT